MRPAGALRLMGPSAASTPQARAERMGECHRTFETQRPGRTARQPVSLEAKSRGERQGKLHGGDGGSAASRTASGCEISPSLHPSPSLQSLLKLTNRATSPQGSGFAILPGMKHSLSHLREEMRAVARGEILRLAKRAARSYAALLEARQALPPQAPAHSPRSRHPRPNPSPRT